MRRVAILDFDVHHGNGTEACVGGVVPAMARHAFKTPFSEGVQSFPLWRPWLDEHDKDNILFARCGLATPLGRAIRYPAEMSPAR